MNTILFLCTGNYYRSRFAEEYFNWLAPRHELSWQATSRALRIELGKHNVGPISGHTRRGLEQLGIMLPEPIRLPRSLELTDLNTATHVIALKESEHRPVVAARFPEWLDRVEYWRVDDVDCADPTIALPLIETEVRRLIARLAQ